MQIDFLERCNKSCRVILVDDHRLNKRLVLVQLDYPLERLLPMKFSKDSKAICARRNGFADLSNQLINRELPD